MIDRASAGWATAPTAAVIDTQTVEAPAPGTEKTVGRERHIAVDTEGRPSFVHLTPADSAGAQTLLEALHGRWPWVERSLADGACDRRQSTDKADSFGATLDIVERTEAALVGLPRRWILERTLGRPPVVDASWATTKP